MAGVRFTALQSRPMAFLDFTSVTLDEFQQLVPPFETAFQCYMAVWRMDGKPRTARPFTVYQNCRLCFLKFSLSTPLYLIADGEKFLRTKRFSDFFN